MNRIAIATSKSQNRKTGRAAVTYAAQGSCPSSCIFLGAGCYAEGATIGMLTSKLNANARTAGPLEIAAEEASAIDACEVAYEGQPMRLHSVGDCSSALAAKVVAAAAARWMERGGGQVWTYTHAWRDVPREAWGKVSVLASCETEHDVRAAADLGYASAIVVDEFPSERRYQVGTAAVLPCPAQTRDVPCTDCRLCFNDARLREEGLTIGFAVHGDAASVRQARSVLNGRPAPKLREVVPVMLSEGKSGADIARETGTNSSSVYEMIRRLREEGVLSA